MTAAEKKPLTMAKAIKAHCFDCAGESSREVTLCTLFCCSLWPYRTGSGPNSTVYRRRMDTALRNYAEEIAKMTADGIETARFSPTGRRTSSHSKKLGPTVAGARG